MKRISALIAVFVMSVSVSACNTISGMGKDVERGGEKVQGAAERKKAD